MTDWHPDSRSLELFMFGDLRADEAKDIVIHLLSGCEPCRRIARESFPCGKAGDLPEEWKSTGSEQYAQIFENVVPVIRAAESQLEQEVDLAPLLLDELERHPHQRRLMLVRNSRKYENWKVCELVIERSHKEGFREPASAVEYGQLAVAISEQISEHNLESLNDLRCRAHSILGNALRISGLLKEASDEFRTAEVFLARGTGDLLERGRYLELKSYLSGELRQFSESLALLDEAIEAYRRQRARHRLGRALIIKGHHLGEKGDLPGAITSLRQGLRYIDEAVEPRLTLVAKHNLTRHFYQAGRYHQALAMLPETRELHEALGDQMDLARFEWLEAVILRDSNDLEAAESILNRVKGFFADKGVTHDTALVSLDLATIYLRQGRAGELKSIAIEMLTMFQALRTNREVIAALVLFQKAVELERATLGLVRDLAAYLKNSKHDSLLPFRPSSTN